MNVMSPEFSLKKAGVVPCEQGEVAAVLASLIDERIDAHLAFAQSHVSMGQAWANQARGRHWTASNGAQRLQDWLMAAGVDIGDLEAEQVQELVLDNFEMSTVSLDWQNDCEFIFTLGIFPVGDIEVSIDLDDFGIPASTWQKEVAKAASRASFFGDVASMSSDYAWHASIHRAALTALIAEAHAEPDMVL